MKRPVGWVYFTPLGAVSSTDGAVSGMFSFALVVIPLRRGGGGKVKAAGMMGMAQKHGGMEKTLLQSSRRRDVLLYIILAVTLYAFSSSCWSKAILGAGVFRCVMVPDELGLNE